MSFWKLSTGQSPSGSEEASFTGSFKIIPDGTTALASIKDFTIDENGDSALYKIIYKIIEGEFSNREVTQKIKCFDAKPSIADRALNMLKRIHDLCNLKPSHANAPNNEDLLLFKGKVLGIKINEWSMIKADGSLSEGNYVSEIHAPAGYECATGVKLDTPKPMIQSALSNNNRVVDNSLADDIPF